MNKNKSNKKKKNVNATTRIISQPSALTKVVKSGNPRVSMNGGVLRVSHMEPVATIVGSTSVEIYKIMNFNPGSLQWLSAFATRFETYVVDKLEFEFITRMPSTANGIIAMRFDTDVLDDVPDDSTSFLSGGLVSSGPVWGNFRLNVPKNTVDVYHKRFNRVGAAYPNGSDPKTYDIGSLSVMTHGQNGQDIGNIYVHYTIAMHTPQIQQIASGEIEDPSPAVDPSIANEYMFTSTTHGTNKLPVSWRLPTASEVTAGADADKYLFSFPSAWEGIMTLVASGTAATQTFGYNVANATIATLVDAFVSGAGAKKATSYRINSHRTFPSWLQPYVTDATNPVTNLRSMWSAGRYSDFAP